MGEHRAFPWRSHGIVAIPQLPEAHNITCVQITINRIPARETVEWYISEAKGNCIIGLSKPACAVGANNQHTKCTSLSVKMSCEFKCVLQKLDQS